VRLTAAGHPAVTGRHDKTLELTAAGSITARATCILAVSAGPLPGGLALLRERVRLTLAAGGVSAAVEGEVNPGWHSSESLIVRRSGQLDADTYLVNATAAAADLPIELLAALRDPGATVEVTAEEVGTPAPVVLVLTGGPATDEIARLAAQADLVVDLTGQGSPAPPVPLPGARQHRLPERVTARTTVVLTDDPAAALPVTRGRRVVLWPPVAGADLLLSAGLPPTPLLQAGRVPTTAAARAGLTRLLTRTPAPAALDPAGIDLAAIAELAPHHTVLTATPTLGWGVHAAPAAPAAPGPRAPEPDRSRRTTHPGAGQTAPAVTTAPDPAASDRDGRGAGSGFAPGAASDRAAGGGGVVVVMPMGDERVGIEAEELARLLRAAGRSGRDTAAALTALGVPRREAYRLAADSARDPR
jgi:hypothetical protein